MKKNLLLMMMCIPVMLAAQNGNGVKVSNLAVSVGSPTTVTFNVSWSNTGMPEVWSDTVWVGVDYNKNGKMERLPLSSGATLTATSPGGKVIEDTGNNKGVWVAGNARSAGNFSATVKLLSATTDVAGACAYASNYPPEGKYNDDATAISFTGTSPYDISLTYSGGGSTTVKAGDMFLLPCDYTVTSFTDATGVPGITPPMPLFTPPYAASTETWVLGTQTWSAPLIKAQAGCTAITDFTDMANPPTVAYYRSEELYSGGGYMYNWKCVNDYATQLCPYPWHVPTVEDFKILDEALGHTISNYTDSWGAAYTGNILPPTYYEQGTYAYYWSSTQTSSNAYCLRLVKSGSIDPSHSHPQRAAHQVRCVRP
jgi:uncharacterized protein (TIGR02145 family)